GGADLLSRDRREALDVEQNGYREKQEKRAPDGVVDLHACRPGAGRGPISPALKATWIPAFAGMTRLFPIAATLRVLLSDIRVTSPADTHHPSKAGTPGPPVSSRAPCNSPRAPSIRTVFSPRPDTQDGSFFHRRGSFPCRT